MKTSYQWQEELGGVIRAETVSRIQIDALMEAIHIIDRANGRRLKAMEAVMKLATDIGEKAGL